MARIIIGVDGSKSAVGAIRWAAEHASPGDELLLANAWNLQAVGGFEAPYLNIGEVEAGANRIVEELKGEIAEIAEQRELTVSSVIEHGHPGQVLIDLSTDADLLVVGSRGFGGFKGLLLGSVSTYVVHHARCPVVVVPATNEAA